jgi:uncharacterized protein (DUF1697 family)
MPVLIGLLRAIGPETHAKMSMADLREACLAAGCARAETYIATGNLILETQKSVAAVRVTLKSILNGFGLDKPVMLRRPSELAALIAANPFPDAAASRPRDLVLCFLAGKPSREGLATLGHYRGPERFRLVGRDLYIDYAEGITGSRLMPSVVERRLGMQATARNWNTACKLLAKARAFQARS